MDIKRHPKNIKPAPKSSSKNAASQGQNITTHRAAPRFALAKKVALVATATIISLSAVLLAIRVAYTGRIYQGIWGNGAYLGGLTKKQAVELLDKQTNDYIKDHVITVKAGDSTWRINSYDIDSGYDNRRLVDEVYLAGRSGSVFNRFADELLLFLNLYPRNNYAVNFDPKKLDHFTANIAETINAPVRNASYSFANGSVTIESEDTGSRIDLQNFNQQLVDHLGGRQNSAIILAPKNIAPLVTAADLENGKQKINSYAGQNITLNYAGSSWQIDRQQILDSIRVVAISSEVLPHDQIENYYRVSDRTISYEPDRKVIAVYLSDIAKTINREAKDAKLTVQNGQAVVSISSQDGYSLNTDASIDAIIKAISSQSNRNVALVVEIKKATVREDNIGELGIKDLLSDGVTTFPGSSADRNTNIRIGASRYDGVLLKPGQEFSFGDYLGDIGPAQGYKQSKVILEGRLENEYGGGLCQVSTTVFRAALLAGLPITERHNHAFAVSYYTAPYGVPGVDATIYYPGVDFRFRNDTNAYLLIQTEMSGTTLHFRFYGTKKKEGVIRGPTFLSGNSDPNQPSKTVFHRDVVADGKVIKTDTFYTSYKSAKDFPPVQ